MPMNCKFASRFPLLSLEKELQQKPLTNPTAGSTSTSAPKAPDDLTLLDTTPSD